MPYFIFESRKLWKDTQHILKYVGEGEILTLSQIKFSDLPDVVSVLEKHRVIRLGRISVHRYFALRRKSASIAFDVLTPNDDLSYEQVDESTVFVFRPRTGDVNCIMWLLVKSTPRAIREARRIISREHLSAIVAEKEIALVGTYSELREAGDALSEIHEPIHDITVSQASPMDVVLARDRQVAKELRRKGIVQILSETETMLMLSPKLDLLREFDPSIGFDTYARELIRSYEEICDEKLSEGSLIAVVSSTRYITAPTWLLFLTPLEPKVFWANARRMKLLRKISKFPSPNMQTMFFIVTRERYFTHDVIHALKTCISGRGRTSMYAFLVN